MRFELNSWARRQSRTSYRVGTGWPADLSSNTAQHTCGLTKTGHGDSFQPTSAKLHPSRCASPRFAIPIVVLALAYMVVGARFVLGLVALLLLAPILAAVMIATLLLLGVEPHLVFLPGFVIKSRLEAFGFHVPNQVGVISTVVIWWAIIVSVWLALRRLWRRAA
jgi:hypothetical protein